MTDIVKIRKDDWEKLLEFHDQIAIAFGKIEHHLDSTLNADVSDHLYKRTKLLYTEISSLVHFLRMEDYPFGITAVGEG